MSEIVFAPPSPDEPGYLRRSRRALEFKERLDAAGGEMTVELVDELIGFLAQYVKQPEEPEARREALLDASESQFKQLLELLSGTAEKKS